MAVRKGRREARDRLGYDDVFGTDVVPDPNAGENKKKDTVKSRGTYRTVQYGCGAGSRNTYSFGYLQGSKVFIYSNCREEPTDCTIGRGQKEKGNGGLAKDKYYGMNSYNQGATPLRTDSCCERLPAGTRTSGAFSSAS